MDDEIQIFCGSKKYERPIDSLTIELEQLGIPTKIEIVGPRHVENPNYRIHFLTEEDMNLFLLTTSNKNMVVETVLCQIT
jgi:hypothetical protein